MFDQFYPGQPIQFMEGLLSPIIGRHLLPSMKDAIVALGLTSGLKVCLDAGDGASLPAASTKWLDTSGNGYDFFLGATGSGTDLPTINGTTGNRSSSEYLSFDAGDMLRYDTTNEAWMQNLHKAGAKFSYAGMAWFGTVANNGIFGTNANNSVNIGVNLRVSGTSFLAFLVSSGAVVLTITSTLTPVVSAWHFIALSVDEAAGTGFIHMNGTNYSFTSTYASPTASDAAFTMEIGARGNGEGKMTSGSRMGTSAMWEGVALSTTQIAALFNATRVRFGI